MAGNRMSTKTRGKEDKSKANNKTQPSEETDETDFALLRKPIHTSITGFGQARKIFDLATEEVSHNFVFLHVGLFKYIILSYTITVDCFIGNLYYT